MSEAKNDSEKFEEKTDGAVKEVNDSPDVEKVSYESEDSYLAEEKRKRNKAVWAVALVAIVLSATLAGIWIYFKSNVASGETDAEAAAPAENTIAEEVVLSQELLNSAGIETTGATQRPAIAELKVSGTVEFDPERSEMATPLVGGRIENVYFGVGDYVERGAVMATISSPRLAELHAKLHDAETRFGIAQRAMNRAEKNENKVTVLQAKAKLDEANATLKRTKRLIELGAGAGKDLISAETDVRTAKAEYDYQSNITLNKELQETKAEYENAKIDVTHVLDEMRAIGVNPNAPGFHNHKRNTSLIQLRAPLSGLVTERKFNPGAGIEAATPVFTISNTGTVFVIASVPETNLGNISMGGKAGVKTPYGETLTGSIHYIEPTLDQTTRTARVRISVPNVGGRLKAGMFTAVSLNAGLKGNGENQIVVPSDAIQRTGLRMIVFIPKKSAGAFEVRPVEIGDEVDGYTYIKKGIELGDVVVTKGAFALKTQLEKGSLEED
ncbi:MAG: efflux RND transporter periplasmic adaptor subunit [Pyrinomonadaceae bacterium]